MKTKDLWEAVSGRRPPSVAAGAKKHYRLLATGHRALTQSLGALRSMTDGLETELFSLS